MSDKTIHIGTVKVPLEDYAVGASAVLGIRDSGKTVTSKGIAEQLLDNGIPIVVFDAVGKWRWMKAEGAGSRGKAYEVVVAGGNAPDLPLTPHSVTEIVRAALKERIPLVIDLFSKSMSKADWRRIVQTAIHLIHYENEGGAVHVFLEEAAEFVPQKIYDGETYAEVEKLVRMGGNASVGITIINQRSQEINKAVLDNCSTALVLGCQIGKNAIQAVERWVELLDPRTSKELTESLPDLKSGEAWVFTRKTITNPSREKIPMCRSFHPDRRTPEIVLKSAKLADTEQFVQKMSASIPKVIEEAKANDVGELKRTVADLKRKLAQAEQSAPKVEQKTVEVAILSKQDMGKIERAVTLVDGMFASIQTASDKAVESAKEVRAAFHGLLDVIVTKTRNTPPVAPRWAKTLAKPLSNHARKITRNAQPVQVDGDLTLNSKQQEILNALAWLESIGNQHPTQTQVGAVALIDPTGGYFSNMVGPLSANGLVERGNGRMALTDAGRKHAQVPESVGTLEDYHQVLRKRLMQVKSAGGKTIEILDAIIAAGRDAELSNESIGEAVGVDHTGGYYSNMIGPLSTLGLIQRNRGFVRPTEILFPEGLE